MGSGAQHNVGAGKSQPTPGASQPSGGPRGLDPPKELKVLWGNSSGKLGGNKGHLASLLYKKGQYSLLNSWAIFSPKTKTMMDKTTEF